VRREDLTHRILTITIVLFLASLIVAIAFLFSYANFLQAVNPIAALTATTVALIGMVWFKKSTN
jgi:CHASE2 domain-containing sensor protein